MKQDKKKKIKDIVFDVMLAITIVLQGFMIIVKLFGV